jgi:CHASE2 domain-containing sensor protein
MKFLKNVLLKHWVIIACSAFVVCLSSLRVFSYQELFFYDLRFKLRPPFKASSNIAIIQISDDSLKKLGQWPLPRDFHASLVDVLKKAGARLVVFDILFVEPTVYDQVFAKSIADAGNVFLPIAFYVNPSGRAHELLDKAHPPLADLNKTLAQSAAGTGYINVFIDVDGKTRRVPLLINSGKGLVPQIGFKAACAWLGIDPAHAQFKKRELIVDKKISLPLMSDGSFLVNYPGPWVDSFRHFSYFDILRSFAETQNGVKPSLDLSVFSGKICFVGLTATGTSDLKPSPLENVYPMMGLQASVFNSIIQHKFIRDAGQEANAVINLAMFLAALFICLRLSLLYGLAANIMLGSIYFWISWGLFAFFGIWTDLFLPLLIIGLTYTGATIYSFLDEVKKRQLLEKELDIARTIQKNFLLEGVEEFAGLDISLFLEPAKFVAGDLYDIVFMENKKMGVFIGDVSGKGIPASLIMAQTISLFRIFARQSLRPHEVLTALNKEIYGKFAGRFVTCLYLVIDTEKKSVTVASAGHGPLLHYKAQDSRIIEEELQADVPLGVMEDVAYPEVAFDFKKGDKIVLCTDGIFEARSRAKQEFGLDPVKKAILANSRSSSKGILDIVKAEVARFSAGAIQHDDMTLIVVSNQERKGVVL